MYGAWWLIFKVPARKWYHFIRQQSAPLHVLQYAGCSSLATRPYTLLISATALKPNGAKRMQIIAGRAFILRLSFSRCQFPCVNWKYEGDQSGLRVKNVLGKSFIKFLHDTDTLCGWNMGVLIERVCWHSRGRSWSIFFAPRSTNHVLLLRIFKLILFSLLLSGTKISLSAQ